MARKFKSRSLAAIRLYTTLDQIRVLGGMTIAEIMQDQDIWMPEARRRVNLLVDHQLVIFRSPCYRITKAGLIALKNNKEGPKKSLSLDQK